MDRDHEKEVSLIGVEIRPPEAADLEPIKEGWSRAVPHDSLGNWADPPEALVFPSHDQGCSRVASVDGRVIGFASVIGEALRGLFVDESHRRQGVGTALLRALSESAKSQGQTKLTVVTCHDWAGSIPGIDVRYAAAVDFLEQRGFEKGEQICDCGGEIDQIDAVSRQRPLPEGCTISEYRPEALGDLKSFNDKDETDWNWPAWVEQFPNTDPGRIRLIARVQDELIGCIDLKLSGSVAGLAFVSVDGAHRRRGIASALLREATTECKRRGAASMFAGYTAGDLYVANGWRVIREYVVMTKQL